MGYLKRFMMRGKYADMTYEAIMLDSLGHEDARNLRVYVQALVKCTPSSISVSKTIS